MLIFTNEIQKCQIILIYTNFVHTFAQKKFKKAKLKRKKMRHETLPQSLTVEKLAQWLYENKVDTKSHTEEVPYTEEEIAEFEHKSSLASRSLDKLAAIEERVKLHLKEGVHEEPISVTIPPTKGRKILTANRIYADKQIDLGYSYTEIDLYGIPDDRSEKILFFDNEGTIWDDYSENMSEDQKHQYIGMFSKEGEAEPTDASAESSAKTDSGIVKEPKMEVIKDEEAQESTSEDAPEANAGDEQDSEQDSVLVSEKVDLNEENQGQNNDGAF